MKIRTQFALAAALWMLSGAALRAAEPPASAATQAAIAPAKEKLILRLLEVTGASKMGDQLFDSLLQSPLFGDSESMGPFLETFRKEVDIDEFLRRIIPIYDKHLSEEDLAGLIAFYETPLGKKVISKMPEIMQESMKLGQQWGMEIAERAMEKLKAQEEKDEGEEQQDREP